MESQLLASLLDAAVGDLAGLTAQRHGGSGSMLEKIEGGRRGQQRAKWLDGIIN